jgi:hypothetical protein
MVRSEYKYHTLEVWVFDFAQQGWEGRGIGRHTPVGCSSSLDEPRAAQLALSSPLGKEDRGREKEQRSRGKGGRCRTSRTRAAAEQGSVERGARADRVESDERWGSEGRSWVAVPKERALLPCGRVARQRRRNCCSAAGYLPDGGAVSC